MRPDEYDAFTRELAERVARDNRVVGLVAVGSMAQRDYRADEWSDHDFFLIVEPGSQESFRADLSWLPRHERIVLAFRETEHGLKVFYDDGHMLEFAVFDLAEIALAGVNRYRVLLDRGGVEEACVQVRDNPRPEQDDDQLFGMVLASALVSDGRGRRGELLTSQFLRTWGLTYLTRLLRRHVPTENASILDNFDALRRFERAYPELGAELAAADADGQLAIMERELRERCPDLPWDAFDAVRARTSRAG